VTLTAQSERAKHQDIIMAELRKKINTIPDMQVSVYRESVLGTGTRESSLEFAIRGPDLKTLDKVSREMMARLKEIPGFIDLDRDLELGKPEIQVRINRDLSADLGVPIIDVANTVRAQIGGTDVVEFKKEGESYDVRLRLVEDERSRPEDVEQLWVRSVKGELVELKNFVNLKHGFGPSMINRLDRQRSVTIFSNLEGKALGDAMPEVDSIAKEILPTGYNTLYIGRTEVFQETGYYIGLAFVLAVILTYMVLASQFESFVHPFSIMNSLPLSFVGAFGMLYITGNSFDLFGMIGLVLLVGLVTKNSILLIEFTNQKKAQGLDVNQALIEAGSIRLRPILMTAISTVAGIIPVVLGIGIGSERRQPMALVVAGGMISSTFLTLIVIPVIYAYLDRFSQLSIFKFIKRKTLADFSEKPQK
jgi:HAE1 family hydrophobic/amphiphilic exporter-1